MMSSLANREWTGSVAALPESLRNLAQEFMRTSHGDPALLAGYLRDHAYTLNEWGDAVDQLYVRLDERPREGCPTNAQGVALAGRFKPDTTSIVVTRGGFGLPDTYLYVVESNSGRDFHCGIDEEGRVSS